MNKTFATLKTNVGAEVQDTSSAFATLIGRFINRRYFQILRAINWQQTNPDHTVTLVSGTQNYALPDDFYKEIAVHDVTNDLKIAQCELGELYRYYGNEISDSGSVERYSIYEDAVENQPTSASAIAFTSSSASDTTQVVQVRGISGGAETYESVTLTGTVAASTTATFTKIKGLSFSAARVGYVTATSNSAAVTNAVVPREWLTVNYKLIKFHYTPTAVATINVPYIIKPFPLSQDYDYPVIDIGDLIEIGAIADSLRYKRQYMKANAYEVNFTHQLNDYIFDKENQPNQVHLFSPTTFDRDNLY